VSERGSASIVLAALVAVLVMVAGGLAGVGRLVAAHVQATTAADAAALAAAPLTFLGGEPAAEAADYAAGNGFRLVGCDCGYDPGFHVREVTVEVVAQVDLGMLGSHQVRARAAAEFDPLDLLGP
jgi:secretion/DNA translocation related TadE-like protein